MEMKTLDQAKEKTNMLPRSAQVQTSSMKPSSGVSNGRHIKEMRFIRKKRAFWFSAGNNAECLTVKVKTQRPRNTNSGLEYGHEFQGHRGKMSYPKC